MTENEIRASMTSKQILLERKLTCEAINGAIAFGYLDTNPPPADDHWLAPFWKIGRERAELESKVSTPSAPAVDAVGDFQQLTEKRAQAIAASVEQKYGDTLRLAVDVAFGTAPAVDAGARDAVTREQIEQWAKLAGIEHFTEKGLERLGDFAIFARAALSDSTEAAAGEPVAPNVFAGFEAYDAGSRRALAVATPSPTLSTETVDKAVDRLAAASGQKLTDDAKRLLQSIARLRLDIPSLPVCTVRSNVTSTLDDAADLARTLLRASSATASDKEGA